MTDKELIKQEIERIEQILDDFNKTNNNTIDNGIVSAKKNICKHIKSFIDSLPEENHFEDKSEMVSKDLDIAATSIIKQLGGMEKDDCVSEHELKIFKAAIELQRKKDQETIELAEDHAMLAGMNKMKEEMMKDAVEAEVFVDYNINFGYGSLTANIDLDEQHLKEGDKVKIIIVKED